MNRLRNLVILLFGGLAVGTAGLAGATPVGTTFTYQGRLNESGSPATGTYDFQFALYEDGGGATQVASSITVGDVVVGDGVFSAELDFGTGVFDGNARWLKISVRAGSSTGAYTELLPLQPIRPAPYALHSPGSGVWSLGGGGIFFDGGNVGVGTDTPASTLDVSGKVRVDGTEGDITFTDPNASLNFASPNGGSAPMMNMYSSGTNNDERSVIAHSPSFPDWGLHYRDVGDSFLFLGAGQTALRVDLASAHVGVGTPDAPDGAFEVHASGGDLLNLTNAAGNVFTVLNNGNLGLGVSSPTSRLEVQGTTTTDVLTVTGGSDLAEPFDVNGLEDVPAGTVLSIDPDDPGRLCVSSRAYERTVAGIVSGGQGIRLGMVMRQQGTLADFSVPVALTGRAYCRVDASYGSIEAGDLLTTSATPGCAMKVLDHARAQGAILGKALTSLSEGRGMVLVLVSLQ